MRFAPLKPEAVEVLARDRMIVETIRHHHLPNAKITKTASDIPILQKFTKIPPHVDQRLEAMALGTAFGDAIAGTLGMKWVQCSDAEGTSLAIRYRKTSLIAFPRSMVIKRMDRNEEIDLPFLFTEVCSLLNQMKSHPELG